jgi:hypothetical protein
LSELEGGGWAGRRLGRAKRERAWLLGLGGSREELARGMGHEELGCGEGHRAAERVGLPFSISFSLFYLFFLSFEFSVECKNN